MAKYRIKRFSWLGKQWAGVKKGASLAPTGALVGGAVMLPIAGIGGLFSKKAALGALGAGALIGGAGGAMAGYSSGVHDYEMEHNPEYKKQHHQNAQKDIEKAIPKLIQEDTKLSSWFNYTKWSSLSKDLKTQYNIILPKEILNYIKFYSNWSKNIKTWYENTPLQELDSKFDIQNFKEYFPIPIESDNSKQWFINEDDKDSQFIYLLTANDAGDDGFIGYSPSYKNYSWDCPEPKGDKTLKEFLLDNIQRQMSYYSSYLSPVQIKLIDEFKRRINNI